MADLNDNTSTEKGQGKTAKSKEKEKKEKSLVPEGRGIFNQQIARIPVSVQDELTEQNSTDWIRK